MDDLKGSKGSIEAADSVLSFVEAVETNRTLTLPQWLLKGIATMTKSQSSEGVPPENLVFTPDELEDWLKIHSDKPISSAKKGTSAYISRLFKQLEMSLEGNTRIESIAVENRSLFYGLPGKIEGGGPGNTNLYRLDVKPVCKQALESFKKLSQYPVPTGGLRYQEQKELSAPRLIKMLDGFNVRGFRLVLLLSFILLPILTLMATLTAPMIVIISPSLSPVVQNFTFWSIVYLALMFGLFGFLYRLIDKRVAMAPDWMTITSKEYLLLEYRAERNEIGQFSHRKTALVHYTAKCPVCNGSVIVNKGGLLFFGRLVGRCNENPVEHIFSFDHITRIGKPLR